MSRPAPLVSKRPQPNNAPVGGTSLGTPLKVRTVTAPAASPPAAAAASSFGGGPAASPVRASASRPAAGAPSASPAAARTPAKAPVVRGFGSSTPSSVVPASSPAASASASAASAASASPAAGKMLSRQRYDTHKATNPFSTKNKFKTSFSEAYVNGRIPCRINHGSVRHTLQWDRPSSELDLPFLLPCVADGLRETEHPYVVIARQAFAELLNEAGQARTAPILSQLIQPLRRALLDADAGVFVAGCTALQQLSEAVGPLLNPHIDLLVQQVHKKAMQKATAEIVANTISALATNGGEEAIPLIKKRVPGFIM